MKPTLKLAVFAAFMLLLCTTSMAQSNVIYFRFTDSQSNPQTNRYATLTGLCAVPGYNGNYVAPFPIVQLTDTNGTAWFTNVIPGYEYVLEFDLPYKQFFWTNGFPTNLTGTNNGWQYNGLQVGNFFVYFVTNYTTNGGAYTGTFFDLGNTNQIGSAALTNLAGGNASALSGGTTNLIYGVITNVTAGSGLLGSTNNATVTVTTNGAPISTNSLPSSILPSAGTNIVITASGLTATVSVAGNVPSLTATNQQWNTNGSNFFGTVAGYGNTNGSQPAFMGYSPTTTSPVSGTFNLVSFNFGGNIVPIMTYNPYHDGENTNGLQDEVGIQAESVAIVGTVTSGYGGWLQVGAGGGSAPYAIDLQYLSASSGTPFRGGSFINWLYGAYVGTNSLTMCMPVAISYDAPTTGWGTLSTYDSYEFGTNNLPANTVPSTITTPRLDVISQIGVKAYGNYLLDTLSTTPSPSATYYINMGYAIQDVFLQGSNTISFTNLALLTNTTFGTANTLHTRVIIRGGILGYPITFSPPASVNVTWENEAGTAVAPTNIAGSKLLDLDILINTSGGVTNCLIHPILGSYTPYTDPDAAKFFLAVTGAGGTLLQTESNAINNLCIAMKSDGSWYSNDVIYPLVGGTTNTESWNLKNTNTFRIAWSANSNSVFVFNSMGVTGDGTNYGLPGITLNSGLTNYSLNEANIAAYTHGGGFTGRLWGAIDASFNYSSIQSNNASFTFIRLNNSSDGNCPMLSTGGFYCTDSHAGTGYGFTNGAPYAPATGTAAPTAIPSSTIAILARSHQGSIDSQATGTLNFFALGGGLSTAMEADEYADVLAFETLLGRQ